MRNPLSILRRVFARGIFPHEFSWLIDNALRRAIITPEELADRIAAGPDATIVELGAGSGYFSRELSARTPGGHVVLLDIQPEMLQKARRKLESARVRNASFVVFDANCGLPLRDSQADVIVLVSVLGEVTDRRGCLESAFRVLRQTGMTVVHESVPDPDLIRFETLVRLAKASGFRIKNRWGKWHNYTAAFAKE
ncbi:MAG: class I SAM-dependent methyltransferase [Gemmatimonadota bacterium]